MSPNRSPTARRIKVYPLSQAAASAADHVHRCGRTCCSTRRSATTASFFVSLDRIVQSEPWLDRDRAMIDLLRSLGIEKGKPFNPDARTKAALEAGVKRGTGLAGRQIRAGLPPFYDGGRWTAAGRSGDDGGGEGRFNDPDQYPVDARGLTYSYAYIGIKRLGAGQFYLISISDKDGNPFDGGKTYRLTVPANPPVEQYWSLTAYDRETHALIRNMPRASRSSQIPEMQKNADGSVDVYFGPAAPAGKESNWVPTDPKRGFEVMFRAYAPTKAFFDKTWKLPDIETGELSERRTMKANAHDLRGGTGLAAISRPRPASAQDGWQYRAGHGRELHPRRDRPLLQCGGIEGGRLRQVRASSAKSSPIDNQTVIRQNRDTLYSAAVFDLDAGPVTVTLPDRGKSLHVAAGDQRGPVLAAGDLCAGSSAPSRRRRSARAICSRRCGRWSIRTTRPNEARCMRCRMRIKVEQPGGPGKFEVPKWDPVSQKKMRDALIVLGTTLTDTSRAFGTKDQVDPVQRLVSAAATWGGNPEKGRHLSQLHAAEERRQHDLQAERQGCAGRWLLVHQPLQRRRLFPEERPQRLFAQQHHLEEERGRLGRHPVRRLRRQDSELPADHDRAGTTRCGSIVRARKS